MNCRELRPFWPMFLDGELTDEDAEPYLQHLQGCESCKKFIDGERRFRQTFRAKSASRDAVPVALRHKINTMSRPVSRRRPLPMLMGSMALASLALFTWTTQSAFTPVLASVAEKHRQALPLDVATNDAQQAQRYVDKHVPQIHLPHFNNKQVQMTGARVVDFPGHHGAMVRYLVGPKAQAVSVAVYKADDHEPLQIPHTVEVGDHRVFFDRVGDLEAAVWQCQGMVYSMVGDIDHDALLAMVSGAE